MLGARGWPRATMTACSIALRSSRTLPDRDAPAGRQRTSAWTRVREAGKSSLLEEMLSQGGDVVKAIAERR